MTDIPSADDLRRDNERLRKENAELRSGLLKIARERAAEAVGLDPGAERWIRGETVEEIEADARTLALKLAGGQRQSSPPPPPSSTSPAADALTHHIQQQHEQAAAIVGGHEGGTR